MAVSQIEIRVFPAYRCDHCGAVVTEEDMMFKNGLRPVVRHICPDGHVEREFRNSVGVTRVRVT